MWARMLFVTNRTPTGQPKYALLDEAVAAISADWVSRLYNLAKKHDITLISIAHNTAVEQLHKRRLRLGLEGAWTIE